VRRLPTSRRLVFVLAAAAAVVTIAASGPSASGVAERKDGASASGNCSKAEAREAVERLRLGHPELANPVYKLLCGAFAGPGSRVMVVSLLGPGSLGIIDWVALGWDGSEWQLLLRRHQAAVLTAAGADIRETVFIFRQGDSRCCPSGGAKSRIWHWNGTHFKAGP
jgi:hypothetical protein